MGVASKKLFDYQDHISYHPSLKVNQLCYDVRAVTTDSGTFSRVLLIESRLSFSPPLIVSKLCHGG